MQYQDEPPLEVFFGTREGDHIRFQVLGQTCPQAEEDWYRAQLNTEIHIKVGTFRGYRSLVMFSDDFHRFRVALKKLLTEENVDASLETGDFLSVDVSADGSACTARMQLDALERDGEEVLCDGGNANWEWCLAIDRASLDPLLAEVTRVSERYPIWSVPRK